MRLFCFSGLRFAIGSQSKQSESRDDHLRRLLAQFDPFSLLLKCHSAMLQGWTQRAICLNQVCYNRNVMKPVARLDFMSGVIRVWHRLNQSFIIISYHSVLFIIYNISNYIFIYIITYLRNVINDIFIF